MKINKTETQEHTQACRSALEGVWLAAVDQVEGKHENYFEVFVVVRCSGMQLE